MDVYSQKEQRAHGTGFVGIEAESDDQIDNLEVYEALINPREAERGGAGQNGPGMMPPMMGMGGGGAGATGAGAGGMNTSMATAANAGIAARVGGPAGAGAAPVIGPAAASTGIGGPTPSVGGLGGGGGLPTSPIPSGPAAAGLPVEEPEEAPESAIQVEPPPEPQPAGELVPTEKDEPEGGGESAPVGTTPDVIAIDPAQVEQVAREWSSLAGEMADISTAAGELQASLEDFGMVQQPAGPYGEVSAGIRELAGGASKEFDEIATGLNFGAQAYRDQETQAAQSVRSAQ